MSTSDSSERFTETPASRPAACHVTQALAALASMMSVSTSMRPAFSSGAMKDCGPTTPLVGWRHRATASAPFIARVAISIFGWKKGSNSPRASPAEISSIANSGSAFGRSGRAGRTPCSRTSAPSFFAVAGFSMIPRRLTP